MRLTKIMATGASLVVAMATHQAALAQSSDFDRLMAMDVGSLRGEIQMRFDAALALSKDAAVINADDPRHVWANEAKAQCGIALGYLKSRTKDPVSIGKCLKAYELMQRVPAPPAPPPPPLPPPPPAQCDNPALIFFEWDNPVPPATEAQQVVDFIAANRAACNWINLTVIGHADKSGSNSYNMKLSQERANNVADMLRPAVPSASVTVEFRGEEEPRVPTEDGVRELQNRRVEIKVR